MKDLPLPYLIVSIIILYIVILVIEILDEDRKWK